MRLADWPRNPYLNDELREWIALHLRTLHAEDLAVYAIPQGREDEARRVLVATEVGLLDGLYAPHGSTARYSLQLRLHPWQAVQGVDLRAATYRLWAHEHRSWWRLRLARPRFDAQTEEPELGTALAELAAACAAMAEAGGEPEAAAGVEEDLRRASRVPSTLSARPVAIGPGLSVPEPAEPTELIDPDGSGPSREPA